MGWALGRHVLIIEDEALISIEIEALLSDQGFDSFDWATRLVRPCFAPKAIVPI